MSVHNLCPHSYGIQHLHHFYLFTLSIINYKLVSQSPGRRAEATELFENKAVWYRERFSQVTALSLGAEGEAPRRNHLSPCWGWAPQKQAVGKVLCRRFRKLPQINPLGKWDRGDGNLAKAVVIKLNTGRGGWGGERGGTLAQSCRGSWSHLELSVPGPESWSISVPEFPVPSEGVPWNPRHCRGLPCLQSPLRRAACWPGRVTSP